MRASHSGTFHSSPLNFKGKKLNRFGGCLWILKWLLLKIKAELFSHGNGKDKSFCQPVL